MSDLPLVSRDALVVTQSRDDAASNAVADDAVTVAHDVCALPLVRRLAALLDRDPATLRDGDPLPRGWHALLFNMPTRQSQLRADGAADLGVALPEIGLPRLMLGGRQHQYGGDIPIGARVHRETRRGAVHMKAGRSGRFALVKVEHRIFVTEQRNAAVTEHQDYVLRAAELPKAEVPPASTARPEGMVIAARTIVPDERLLFRYSAITDNPHRIHYDHAYATAGEGYPTLVVNGSIPALYLLEMFRATLQREPRSLTSRNVAPMFCGRPLHLTISTQSDRWRLWATDDQGQTTFEAQAE